jgi:hypothetical protein
MPSILKDLTQYRIGAVPVDALSENRKYRFFRRFLNLSLIIIHKSVLKYELDLLKFIPLGKKAKF